MRRPVAALSEIREGRRPDRQALKEHFRNYLKMLGTLKVKSTDKFVETHDSIFLEATMTSDLGEARVYDAFVLKNG